MPNRLQGILKKQIDLFRTEKEVIGILVFGSVARGGSDQFSDIDLYILVRRARAYHRHNFVSQGIRVDTFVETPGIARKWLKREARSVRRPFAHMLAHGKVVFSRTSHLSALLKMARTVLRSRTRLTRSERLMHLYSLEDFYGEVQRFVRQRDMFALDLSAELLRQNLLELFLKYHGDYFRRPNELFPVLYRHSPAFARLMRALSTTSNPQQRVRKFGTLVHHVYKLLGALPGEWKV